MTTNRRYDLVRPNVGQQTQIPTEAEIQFTPNTGQTDFTLPNTPSRIVRAYANGILINPSDYELQGNTFRWIATVYSLDPSIIIYIVYQL